MKLMRSTCPLLIALIVFSVLPVFPPVVSVAITADLQSNQIITRPVSADPNTNPAIDELWARGSHSEESSRFTDAFADPNTVFSVGTGWPIETGHVVTNNHVISDSDEIILVDREGNEMLAWPVLRDEQHDIALLAVKDTDQLPPALPLAGIQALQGADVFTIGFPKPESPSDLPSRSTGVISEMCGVNADPNTYQTTVPG